MLSQQRIETLAQRYVATAADYERAQVGSRGYEGGFERMERIVKEAESAGAWVAFRAALAAEGYVSDSTFVH